MTKEETTSQDQVAEQLITEAEKDKQITERLQSTLDNIKSFEPSGNIAKDFNNLLEATKRESLYKKVDQNEDPQIILAGLTGIKTAWEQTQRDPGTVDTENEAKKLFFIDVPQAKLAAINKTINYYISKYSNEKTSDDSFEKFRENAFAKTENIEAPQEKDEITLEDIDNDLELSEEDKTLCKEWQKTADELQSMPISNKITEDYNKFIELTDDDNLFNKVKADEKADTTLQNFINLQAVWESALSEHETRPAMQKASMREIFLNTLKQNIETAKKFVDYYKVKQSLEK